MFSLLFFFLVHAPRPTLSMPTTSVSIVHWFRKSHIRANLRILALHSELRWSLGSLSVRWSHQRHKKQEATRCRGIPAPCDITEGCFPEQTFWKKREYVKEVHGIWLHFMRLYFRITGQVSFFLTLGPLIPLISNVLSLFTAAAHRRMIHFMQTLQHARLSYCASLCQISLFFVPLQAPCWW